MPGPSPGVGAAAPAAMRVDLRRLPWIRPLVADYTQRFSTVASLFAGDPSADDDWRRTIARVAAVRRNRGAVADALRRQLERRGAPEAARRAAARLTDPASVAILTGQQPSLFGGPLYTLLKAVTAIQLARRTEASFGVPVVAVFWVDAEDHDWDEVRTATILDGQFVPASVAVADLPGARQHPVGRIVFDEGIVEAVNAMAARLPVTEFTSAIVDSLRGRYTPGSGLGAAFAGWMDELAGRHGLVVFESDDPSVKAELSGVFDIELADPGLAAKLAREGAALMTALGHEPQVLPADDSVALFYLDADGRRAIRRQDHALVVGGSRRPAEAWRDEARQHPERFSPNVLLRPIAQDRLFPTACYVAGPSELAYQAQLGGVYRAWSIEPPLLYPRASVTLLDAAAVKFLERSALPFEALQAQDDAALNRLLARQLPPELDRAILDTEYVITDRAAVLRSAVAALDPTLTGAVDTTADRMRETLRTLQGKIVQAAKRKDETLRRQFTRARALAFPGGMPQERILNVTYFLNRHGIALSDWLVRSLPLDTGHHYLLTP